MKIKKTASTLFLIAMLCLGATKAKAQVNAQLFYDSAATASSLR